MTLKEMAEAGIEFEGYIKVQCWEDEDNPEVYYEGNDFRQIPEKYLGRTVRFIFPYMESDSAAGITVEIYGPENKITKEMVRKGIIKGTVKFIVDPNLESGTVCSIGEYWFYFGGAEAEGKDPEAYLKGTNMEKLVCSVLTALDWLRDEDEDNGGAEYGYYFSVLSGD